VDEEGGDNNIAKADDEVDGEKGEGDDKCHASARANARDNAMDNARANASVHARANARATEF
jgi:hypothetical protein